MGTRAARQPHPAGLGQAALQGALGFGLASLLVFGTVAFGERQMYQLLGQPGAYAVWTLMFILPSGTVLRSLVRDTQRSRSFPLLFAGAFFLYAAGWMAGYFLLRESLGEHLSELAASSLSSLLLAGALAVGLRAPARFRLLLGILFAANTAGYFLGGAAYFALGRPAGMLLWGVLYGVLLGGGLGAALHLAQEGRPER